MNRPPEARTGFIGFLALTGDLTKSETREAFFGDVKAEEPRPMTLDVAMLAAISGLLVRDERLESGWWILGNEVLLRKDKQILVEDGLHG